MEADLRVAMRDMVEQFPAHWRPALQAAIVVAVPAQFLRSMLPLFEDVSQAKDLAEMLVKQGLRDAPVCGRGRPS